MDDRFFTAFFPGEATICGRRLRTFSAYHFLILSAIDSPFLSADGVIRPADLIAAIRVCSKKFGDGTELKPRLRDFISIARLNRDERRFRRECRNFAAFMDQHCSGPKFWERTSGGAQMRDLTGPIALIPIVSGMMRLGISEAEAWDMSLGRLQWYNAQASEIEGSDRRFLDERELEETDLILREMEEEAGKESSHA